MTRQAFVGSVLLFAACGAWTPEDPSVTGTEGAASSSGDGDTAPPEVPDGEPTRLPCTDNFGSGLSSTHGRLDGVLVAIVLPGSGDCNDDDDHLHLQVLAKNGTYDVAVNIRSTVGGDPDVRLLTWPAPLTHEPWTEGWHPGIELDYLEDLDVHSSAFTPYPIGELAQQLEDALADANHVSIYGTGYGPDGLHKIHRDSSGRDGAVVLEPLSGASRFLLFHFASQSF